MARIDGQRRKNGEDAIFEHRVEIGTVVVVEIVVRRENNADTGKFWNKIVEEDALGRRNKCRKPLADFTQLLRSRSTVGSLLAKTGSDLIFQTCNAHLKEFIEVLRKDRNELCSFEKWNIGVRRKRKDARVEIKP